MTPDPQPQQPQKFTNDEITAAKNIRDQITLDNIDELKSIYMAGEIVMWDELYTASPSSEQQQPGNGEEKKYPPNIEKSIDKDPICSTALFSQIKGNVAGIMFDFLGMNEAGTHIEANPATHVIAKYIYNLLQGRDEKDKEIERIKELLRKDHETITLLMCPQEMNEEQLVKAINDNWEQFKTENNL